MQRPRSIIAFERLYLASWVISIANTVMGWPAQKAALARDPRYASNPQMVQVLDWTMPVVLVLMVLVALLLWYYAARRGAVVAKWIIVVFTALGAMSAIGVVVALIRGQSATPTNAFVSLVCTLLAVAAAAMLFRPDARQWFGETKETTRVDGFR